MPSRCLHICIPEVGLCACAIPDDIPDVTHGQGCVVALRHGQEFGTVKNISLAPPPPSVTRADFVRLAIPADMERLTTNAEVAEKVMDIFRQHAEKRELPVHPTKSRFSFRREKLTLWVFTEERTVPLQPISEALQRQFATFVEIHQMGRRDEAAALGGLGHCGRPLCCMTWLKRLDAVATPAPDAGHSASFLNHGVCGCLRCCLGFNGEG